MAGKDDDLIMDGEDDAGASFIKSEDDDISAALRTALGDDDLEDDNQDDDGGFNAPLDDDDIQSRNTVDEEDGIKRVRDAADGSSKKKADEPKEDGKKGEEEEPTSPDGKKPKDDDEGKKDDDPKPKEGDDEAKPKEPDGEKKEFSDDDYNAAIASLPQAARDRLDAERAEFNEIMAPIHAQKDLLEQRGVEPKDAVKWLTNVNDYANRDPQGYAAWFISQSTGGDAAKAEAILKGAAEKLGYEVKKVEAPSGDVGEEDDPFMSDRERELSQKLREAEAKLQGQQPDPMQNLGPDSPQEQNRRIVQDVITETGADGQLVRPHFEKLQPMMLAIVRQDVASGKPMTKESLAAAYEQAELAHPDTRQAATERLLASQKNDAQPATDVGKQDKDNAAALEKAKNASNKIIDGPGQGAGSPPAATDPDVGLEEFLRQQMSGG